jgi:signal transduction histidine kinase
VDTPPKDTDFPAPRSGRRPGTLAARLATALVLTVLVATGAAAGWGYARGRAGVVESARERLNERARLAADRLERAVAERQRLAALWPGLDVAQDLAVDDIDKRLATSLAELVSHAGGASLAVAADTAGRVVAASDARWIGRRAAREAWYLPPSRLPADGAALRTVGARDPVLAAAGPVRATADGRLLGQIALLTPWSALAADAAGADSARMTVRDASGRLLFRGHAMPPAGALVTGRAWARDGLSVETAIPIAEALGPLRDATRRLVLLAALFLLVAVPGALLLVRSTTRELARLTRQAEQARRSGTPAFEPASPGAPADVRTLADALAAMAARVEESRRELARQETLAALGTMAAGLAHEVRTPLSVIRGSAEMMERRAPPGSREAELGDFIIEEVDRLGRLVDDMLAFARPREPDLHPADLGDVARRAAEALQRGHPDACFLTKLQSAPVLADAGQVYQVVLNLAANAAQASPPGGKVSISTRAESAEAVLEVADRGRGIAPEDLPNVWTPFFSRRHGGTGLGLPIVRRIVEAHGGRVEIDSRPGEGTRVTVRLPLRK